MTGFLIVSIVVLLLSNTFTFRCARTLGYEKALEAKQLSEPVNYIAKYMYPEPTENWKLAKNKHDDQKEYFSFDWSIFKLTWISKTEKRLFIVQQWPDLMLLVRDTPNNQIKLDAYWDAIVKNWKDRIHDAHLLSNDTELGVHPTTDVPA